MTMVVEETSQMNTLETLVHWMDHRKTKQDMPPYWSERVAPLTCENLYYVNGM